MHILAPNVHNVFPAYLGPNPDPQDTDEASRVLLEGTTAVCTPLFCGHHQTQAAQKTDWEEQNGQDDSKGPGAAVCFVHDHTDLSGK